MPISQQDIQNINNELSSDCTLLGNYCYYNLKLKHLEKRYTMELSLKDSKGSQRNLNNRNLGFDKFFFVILWAQIQHIVSLGIHRATIRQHKSQYSL